MALDVVDFLVGSVITSGPFPSTPNPAVSVPIPAAVLSNSSVFASSVIPFSVTFLVSGSTEPLPCLAALYSSFVSGNPASANILPYLTFMPSLLLFLASALALFVKSPKLLVFSTVKAKGFSSTAFSSTGFVSTGFVSTAFSSFRFFFNSFISAAALLNPSCISASVPVGLPSLSLFGKFLSRIASISFFVTTPSTAFSSSIGNNSPCS